jgi:hypothetical protein
VPWLPVEALVHTGTPPVPLGARLLVAFALGWLVAVIYRRTNGGAIVPSFLATLVLLTILIAAVTQVIGDNVARAFSLVGALSIVRFRTVVQDTRDTAFVIFAVTVGMAVGAGDLWVAALSLLVVGVAAAAISGRFKPMPAGRRFSLTVCLGLGQQADAVLAPVFQKHVSRSSVSEVGTANRGASLETRYEIVLLPGSSPAALVDDVNALEGIQAVQLRLSE